jgi:hypothetical protein
MPGEFIMMQQYLLVPALVEALDRGRPDEERRSSELARLDGLRRLDAIIAALIAPAITMPLSPPS